MTSIATGLCIAVVGGLAAWAVPSFAETLAEMDVELPLVTQALVGVPARGWLVGGLVAAAVLVLKDFVVPRRAAFVLNATAIVLAALALAVGWFAVFQPLVEAIRAIQ